MKAKDIDLYINKLLDCSSFKDYCFNGIQLEGRDSVNNIITSVTASLAVIEYAAETGCDALLVHHGLFWNSDIHAIRGNMYKRVKSAIEAGINIYAYHLPLDAHIVYGNNKQLGLRLGWDVYFCTSNRLLAMTDIESESIEDISSKISSLLGREPLKIIANNNKIKKIVWCTGAGQDFIYEAINLGADLFISGEASERTWHIAKENSINYLAIGHHCSERYGVISLGEHLASSFNLNVVYKEDFNPI